VVHSAEELRAEVVILAGPTRHSHAETADQVVEDVAEPCREALAEMTAQARHEGIPATVPIRHEVIEANQTQTFDAHVREHGFDLVIVGRHEVDAGVRPRIGGASEH
jgi:nucleotide-binding universal stress UspA family protein